MTQKELEDAFYELYEKASHIRHWHNTGENDEGTVVSSIGVYALWDVLRKYEYLKQLIEKKKNEKI